MSNVDYYSDDLDEVLGILGITGLSIAAVVGIVFCTVFVCIAINYLLYRIPLYKMAKTAGMPNAGLIWIPYCAEYVLAVLPEGEFMLFKGFFRVKKRINVFFILLGIQLGSGIVLSIISLFNSVLATMSFGISSVFTFPVYMLITLVINVALRLLSWRLYYDLFECFDPENHSTNLAISIIGVFIPIVQIVYLYIEMNKVPSYGAGNWK